ncbi:ATP synthase protein I [Atopomonas hussainii]|uniref:ATP synthase protein I n=1 Tax=Atopomonas hussainii TaxID=1429083 RepID=A0A1H7FIS0_9GAMM|nr:F0F1 ATP synthase subunit I [Atopomonas hussainii]SEK25921.1 ATP synthase protein I [Atopomonas hussainii]
MTARTPAVLPLYRLPVFPVLVAQFAVAVLLALLVTLVWGVTAGKSALLGGLVVAVPTLYLARKAFRHQGARAAREIVRGFYAGEAGKLVFSAFLMAVIFVGVKPLHAPAFFVAMLLTQATSWFAPLLLKLKKT